MKNISFSREDTFLLREDMTVAIKAALQDARENYAKT